jgi:carbon storage regulator CsrA
MKSSTQRVSQEDPNQQRNVRMLVLSRKINQEIVIGENIKITVLKVKGNTVRLGIDAPREIHVVRGELAPKSQTTDVSLSHDALPTKASAQSSKPTSTEFTVVFRNDNEPANVDVVPFKNDRPSAGPGQSTGPVNRFATNDDGKSEVISFRGQVPQPLQRNRLQDMVRNMTAKTESSTEGN